MRMVALLLGDIKFQYKYGFHALYTLFALLYTAILQLVGKAWRAEISMLMAFSDPALLGLFFMGAILQFEKDEHTLHSLAVSPVRIGEYVLAKLCSLGLISCLVALVLAAVGGILNQPVRFATALFLGSCLFSSLGLVLAAKTHSLNQFLLASAACELLIIVPAGFSLFSDCPVLFLLHPGCSLIEVCMCGEYAMLALLSLLLWSLAGGWLAVRATESLFITLGGSCA